MSKTTKIAIGIGAFLFVIVICVCFIIGTLFILGNHSGVSATPLSTQEAIQPAYTQEITQPTLPAPTNPVIVQQPTTLPSDGEFVLNGVTIKVYSTIYSTINGGEDSALYATDLGEVYFLVSLYSSEKDLSFIYEEYADSVALIYEGEPTSFNYMNWSDDESPVNSGYVKISFPIYAPLSEAVLHITEGVDIDLTPFIPTSIEYADPWLDAQSPFLLDNVQLQISSIDLYDNYPNPVDGAEVEKQNSTDKILVISFSSPQNDLSQFGYSVPFVLIDRTNLDNQYWADYIAWTYGDSQEPGDLQYIFVIPEYTGTYTLYIPYDTLIDLTPLMK